MKKNLKIFNYIYYFNIFYLWIIFIVNLSISKENTKFLSLKELKYSKEYNNLFNFIISNGGYINPKLVPNEISKSNRFIIAKELIKKNEKILFIPDKVLISRIHKSIFKHCRDAYGIEDGYEYDCIVYFMTIDNYNSSSFFKPYYDYLPTFNQSDFIFDFSEKEIKMFEGTGITEGIRNYKHFYKRALEPVKEKLKKFAEEKNIKYEDILEKFKYNFDLVATRNFGRPESYCDLNTMVPYMDLINHSDKNNTYWYYEDLDEGYTLISVRDIQKNEEITDSYGKYHNSMLYRTYGFVIPGNIYHDYVYVNISGESFTLNIDYLNSNVDSMFEKMVKRQKLNFDDAKNSILKDLNNKKSYYLKLKTNRYSLNIIIKEHIDLLDKAIEKVLNYNKIVKH